jgi:hypothetical protein
MSIITADTGGGVGAQMFMIAHAVCQGWKNNVPVKFLLQSSKYPGRNWDTVFYKDTIFRNIEFVDDIGEVIRIEEKTFNEPDLNFSLDKSVEFYGCFQSHKNFFGYDKDIQKLFGPTEEFKTHIKEKYPQLNDENTLSLHVRRGDFLTIPNSHPTLDISYINEAIKQNGEYSTLFAFSDDKEWLKQNVQSIHPNVVVVEGIETYEELWMMGLCTNHIIGNSTYGYWGAFLDPNDDKKVFVPSPWFGPTGPKFDDDRMAPEDWIRIPVEWENGKLTKK